MRWTFLTLLLAFTAFPSGCTLVSDFGGYSGADGRMDGGADTGADGTVDGSKHSELDGSMDSATDSATGTDSAMPDGGLDSSVSVCTPSCAPGETCVAGTCRCGARAACAAGDACCGGSCVDVDSDVTMCGGCGMPCPSVLNSIASCVRRVCAQACEGGFQDCDGVTAGCETPILDGTHCGTCGNTCAAGTFCANVAGTYDCASSCTGGLAECSGACVDHQTNVSHCGGCGAACPFLANTMKACVAGGCVYACLGDFVDCNGDLSTPATSDGCEAVPSLYYFDGDGDGVGAGVGMSHCLGDAPFGWVTVTGDCEDSDVNRYPGNTELCNGLDENCDGVIDDGNPGGGASCGTSTGTCSSGAQTCVSGSLMCGGGTGPEAEICDGLDNDCNGTADDGSPFECVAGMPGSCTVSLGGCTAMGTRNCDGFDCTWDDCVVPGETCDGVDENCDGFIDDDAYALSARTFLVAGDITVSDIGMHPMAGQGGAVAYFLGGAPKRVIFQRLAEDLSRIGGPVVVAQGAEVAWPLAMGWDGAQWSVFYPVQTATPTIRQARVSETGVLGAATDVGPGSSVQATSDGSSVGVVIRDGFGKVQAGIYSSGTWTRSLGDLLAGNYDAWIDVEPVGGGGYVGAGAENGGEVRYRTFDTSGLGTMRSVLRDALVESPIDLAVDPGARRLAIGWKHTLAVPTPEAGVTLFDLATGGVIGTNPAGRNEAHVSFEGGDFFVEGAVIRRMRSSNAALYPESYTILRGSNSVSGWRGAYRSVRVYGGGGTTYVQGIGCP